MWPQFFDIYKYQLVVKSQKAGLKSLKFSEGISKFLPWIRPLQSEKSNFFYDRSVIAHSFEIREAVFLNY